MIRCCYLFLVGIFRSIFKILPSVLVLIFKIFIKRVLATSCGFPHRFPSHFVFVSNYKLSVSLSIFVLAVWGTTLILALAPNANGAKQLKSDDGEPSSSFEFRFFTTAKRYSSPFIEASQINRCFSRLERNLLVSLLRAHVRTTAKG